VPCGDFDIGEFRITSTLVGHPGPTVGYRLTTPQAALAYIPDHEPALGVRQFPLAREWTSGYTLAAGADLLIHDAQYSREEYPSYIGWGHSSLTHALAFAVLAEVKQFVPFHHDPAHTDADLDRIIAEATAAARPTFTIVPGAEGAVFDLGAGG